MGGTENKVKKGVHIVVATPGRLAELTQKQKINLDMCELVMIDECERLLENAFEESLKTIFDNLPIERQTCVFSSSLASKVQEFIKQSLNDPIIINVGRSGAANMNVIQDVEYIKQEQKLPQVIEALNKTPPPVLIFCENKDSVDDLQEYLLLQNVSCVSLHSGKSQQQRTEAIYTFKQKKADILIATDIASKGLDFQINHVINFDMPKEIETYVHRIGRTGRTGTEGRASTFINRSSDIGLLVDLKYVLKEAKQEVPTFLKMIKSQAQSDCGFCGGLGHQIFHCPKMEIQRQKANQQKSQVMGKLGGDM